MKRMLTYIRCVLVWVVRVLLSLIGWPFYFRLPYSEYLRWMLRFLRRLDPNEECRSTSYVRRCLIFWEKYPEPSAETLPVDPLNYIGQFIQDVGLCPEVIVRCAKLTELYARGHQWQQVQQVAQQGYQLAIEWYKQPRHRKCRLSMDFILVPAAASEMIVVLWILERCREEQCTPQIDPSHSLWLQSLAQSCGIDEQTLRSWLGNAWRHIKEPSRHRTII